ncbi:hypothetical protein [Acinetobacter terrae]|uniref:Uncharacterized protein n=1 Tax=Acinetobacter terrae TaxID=2731247 RepID=A0A8E4F645_9GAMM|nr:hypothetical protein [Acinetobacter terrae]NNH37330.1 hypothetical protein [Acinetobacter terrae]
MNDVFKNMKVPTKIIFFSKQKGFSSLLFIVLVGLSLTVLTVGYMSSMRNLQSSATTAHAQTQAQMQAMIGYQALGGFLKAQSLTNIAKIETGTVSGGTSPIQFKKIACGTNQYCFDIVGKSGGATSIIRSKFIITDELESKSQTGSVFAGGLRVNKLEDLSASGVTLEVSGGIINKNNNQTYDATALNNAGITVVAYTPKNFIRPQDLRKDANYIFTLESGNAKCTKNNFFDATQNKQITVETEITCPLAVTRESDSWVVNGNSEITGVLWFDGNVIVNLSKTTDFINTVISTQKIKTELLSESQDANYNAFAPHHYYITATEEQKTARAQKVCPTDYLLQYCQAAGQLKSDTLMAQSPATISNILFLSQTLELAAGKEKQHNIVVNYYGNLIANGTSGGTGSPSGKFTGTGVLNIRGNVMVVGEADMTEMLGDFSMKLTNAQAAGNVIPFYKKVFSVGGIRYM